MVKLLSSSDGNGKSSGRSPRIGLLVCYALSGTNKAYADRQALCPYRGATRCPALTQRMPTVERYGLRAC
eukprot:1673211-Rhodomonas_salina.1